MDIKKYLLPKKKILMEEESSSFDVSKEVILFPLLKAFCWMPCSVVYFCRHLHIWSQIWYILVSINRESTTESTIRGRWPYGYKIVTIYHRVSERAETRWWQWRSTHRFGVSSFRFSRILIKNTKTYLPTSSHRPKPAKASFRSPNQTQLTQAPSEPVHWVLGDFLGQIKLEMTGVGMLLPTFFSNKRRWYNNMLVEPSFEPATVFFSRLFWNGLQSSDKIMSWNEFQVKLFP